MHLTARLGDVATGAEDYFAVTRSEADLALGDDGVLILQRVQVGYYQRADGKWMLDDGHGAVGLTAQELELDADSTQPAGGALAGSHDGQGWRVGQARGRGGCGGGHIGLLSAEERSAWMSAGLVVQCLDDVSCRRPEQAEAGVLGGQVCGQQVLHLGVSARFG